MRPYIYGHRLIVRGEENGENGGVIACFALVITNSLIITSYLISLVIVSENKVTRAYSRLLTTVLCMFSCSVRFDMSRRNKAATATGINRINKLKIQMLFISLLSA